jgi:hypothetical protein
MVQQAKSITLLWYITGSKIGHLSDLTREMYATATRDVWYSHSDPIHNSSTVGLFTPSLLLANCTFIPACQHYLLKTEILTDILATLGQILYRSMVQVGTHQPTCSRCLDRLVSGRGVASRTLQRNRHGPLSSSPIRTIVSVSILQTSGGNKSIPSKYCAKTANASLEYQLSATGCPKRSVEGHEL